MTKRDSGESMDELLNPHRAEELAAADRAAKERLRELGVRLNGQETGEQLVAIVDAVERFEQAVEAAGGDLMVDEGPHGKTREPDDPGFVLPKRNGGEAVAAFVARIDEATAHLRAKRRRL
jgi:hypothetical protein